jgi:mannose-6-phosphate isomerase-like protein (cupin superfamily)
MMMLEKINLNEKLATFSNHWSPKLVGRVNDTDIRLVKFQGEFHWHHHEREDELFLVLKGSFIMRLRDGDVTVNEGEFILIPKGTEHMPYAPEEVHVMLIEPSSTLNTGNVLNERTVEVLEKI